MRPLHRAVHLTRTAALLGIFVSAFSAAAPPAATDLARCAGIAAPDARLACYDALAGRSAERTPAVASTPAAPPIPAAAATDPQNFGLTPAQAHAPPAGPAAIKASIAKILGNPAGHTYAILDNGQTWLFVDAGDDAGLSPGDPITIKRGSLGSFLMITPSKRSYHVRRTQ